MISADPPTPTSSTGLFSSNLSVPSFPSGLPEPYEAPHLIISIDKANPAYAGGNGYSAQLSPTFSTIFVYDVDFSHVGKMCTLAFYVPSLVDSSDFTPLKISALGGISVSRLSNQVSTEISPRDVRSSDPIGSVTSVLPGHQYNFPSVSCEAGQEVGYQVDSLFGLTMNWFQMTNPPIGLFMLVS